MAGAGLKPCATGMTLQGARFEAEVGRGCDVLYPETPTKPTLKVVDIARLAAAGRAVGATVVVDNTFATPINQRPLNLGAHLVLHSATKFMGGHSDAMGGVVSSIERRALQGWLRQG